MKTLIVLACVVAVASGWSLPRWLWKPAALPSVQSYKVKGRFVCGNTPVKNAKIKVVDKDTLRDDTLWEGRTNSNGEFEASGSADDTGSIDTLLKVYHDCDRSRALAATTDRQTDFKLPSKYINTNKVLNMHTINLQLRFKSSEEIELGR